MRHSPFKKPVCRPEAFQSDGILKVPTLLMSPMVLDKVMCFLQYFSELRQQGVGCYWNSYFAGAYAYADDLAILAPSASALRRMLRCCESFASLHGLKFNPAKSHTTHQVFSSYCRFIYTSQYKLLWYTSWLLQHSCASWQHSFL